MLVVITGGAGFLGLRLARKLVAVGSLRDASGAAVPIDELVLVDVRVPSSVPEDLAGHARFESGDIVDPTFVRSLLGDGPVTVFHLAAVVSSQGEADFDLAMAVNLDAVRGLLEALRHHPAEAHLVATSSIAVFGSDAGHRAGDTTNARPQTTYGMTKLMLELLVNDYTRKGFLDGRVARLPTVIIRPGAPNGAASSAASAIFREPLAGIDYVVPLVETTPFAVAGAGSITDGLVALHDVPSSVLGLERTVTLPSISTTVAEMASCVQGWARDRTLGEITVVPDPAVQSIVDSWPAELDASRAAEVGLPPAWGLDDIVRDYLETDVQLMSGAARR